MIIFTADWNKEFNKLSLWSRFIRCRDTKWPQRKIHRKNRTLVELKHKHDQMESVASSCQFVTSSYQFVTSSYQFIPVHTSSWPAQMRSYEFSVARGVVVWRATCWFPVDAEWKNFSYENKTSDRRKEMCRLERTGRTPGTAEAWPLTWPPAWPLPTLTIHMESWKRFWGSGLLVKLGPRGWRNECWRNYYYCYETSV